MSLVMSISGELYELRGKDDDIKIKEEYPRCDIHYFVSYVI